MRFYVFFTWLLLFFGMGCAETVTQPVLPAPRQAAELVVFVHAARQAENELCHVLARAGYRVTRDPNGHADFSARLEVKGEDARYLGIFVSHDVKDYQVTLEVLGRDSILLDSLSREFTASNIAEANLAPLVNELHRSRGLNSVLVAHQQQRALEAEQLRRQEEEKRQRAEAESQSIQATQERWKRERESAWQNAGAESCANPTTSRSCDGVRAFIDAYGAGEDVEVAQRSLNAAGPKLVELRDDETWSLAAADDCKTPARLQACDGVARYVTEFPEGRHAKAGRELLARSAATITRLRRATETQITANDRAYADYGSTSVVLGPGGGRTVPVRGYTRKNGTYVRPHYRSPRR